MSPRYAIIDARQPVVPTGAQLLTGVGPNYPGGMAIFWEMDVTQPNQASHNASIGSTASEGFYGTTWTTPDGNGTGAYWNLVKDGYRCMEQRWGVGALEEGRACYHEVSAPVSPTYTQLYVVFDFYVDLPHDTWPAGTIKLYDWDDGNNVVNISNNPNSNAGFEWLIGNILASEGSIQYVTNAKNLAPIPTQQWCSSEVVVSLNTGSNFDGTFDLYLNGTHVTGYTGEGGGGMPSSPTDIRYAVNPALTLLKIGSYRGGDGMGLTISTQSSVFIRRMHWRAA